MTRKDYVLIADALARCVTGGDLRVADGVDEARRKLADALERDNPRFDRERFLRAAEGR